MDLVQFYLNNKSVFFNISCIYILLCQQKHMVLTHKPLVRGNYRLPLRERESERERTLVCIIMGWSYCPNNKRTLIHLTLFQYQIAILLGPKARTHPHVIPPLSNLLLQCETTTCVVGYLAYCYVVCNHSLS